MKEKKNRAWYRLTDALLGEHNRWNFVGVVYLFAGTGLLIYLMSSAQALATIETWISIGTFFLATVYGLRGLMVSRSRSLKKVITVHYKIKQPSSTAWSYLYTCHKFSLAAEGDIRALSQQIGRQMSNGSDLEFTPNYDQEPPVEIRYLGEDVLHYEVTFYLTALPTNYAIYDYKQWWWDREQKECRQLVTNGCPDIASKEEDVKEIYDSQCFDLLMVNLSNHQFDADQRAAAVELLNTEKKHREKDGSICHSSSIEIEHVPFPQIDPNLPSKALDGLVQKYFDTIMAQRPLVVCINGEATFCHRLINRLQSEGVRCYTSTTKREAVVEGDTKISIFKHVQFRPYN